MIIPFPSGVIYSNQAGGYSCQQPIEEGVFSSLNEHDGTNPSNELLEYFFKGPKWQGRCDSGIDGETVAFLEALFSRYSRLSKLQMKVDYEQIADSMEAWIYVTYKEADTPWLFNGFNVGKGILTWNNSD